MHMESVMSCFVYGQNKKVHVHKLHEDGDDDDLKIKRNS